MKMNKPRHSSYPMLIEKHEELARELNRKPRPGLRAWPGLSQ